MSIAYSECGCVVLMLERVAIMAIEEVRNSEDGVSFMMRTGEPDAGRLEH